MRNDGAISGIGALVMIFIGFYTVWWSWNYLSNQLDSTVFALFLTIPLTGIIFVGLQIAFTLTFVIFAALFGNSR